MSDTVRIVVIAWAAIGVVALVMYLTSRETRAEREARDARRDAVFRALLEMTREMGLGAPMPEGGRTSVTPGFVVNGRLGGCRVELHANGMYDRIRVELEVPALPHGFTLTPWPKGRGAEDIYLGLVVESGHEKFDAHFCVGGPIEGLADAAAAIDRRLLDVIAESYDVDLPMTVGMGTLQIEMPYDPMGRRDVKALPYIRLWRAAARVVERGVAAGVFEAPDDHGAA